MTRDVKVRDRKEFVNLFRTEFIPNCNRSLGEKAFDFGYAINNWTCFWYFDEAGTFVTVELE